MTQPQRLVTGEGHPGSRIVWHRLGAGEPVLMLHGGMGSWTHWIRNLDVVARDHLALAVDMPGFGDSDSPQGNADPAALANGLATGLDELIGPRRELTLVAFSFGGTVAAELLLRRPEQVRRLILVGSSGLGVIRPGRVVMERWQGVGDPAELAAIHRRNLSRLMISRIDRVDDEAVRMHASNLLRGRVRSVEHSLGDSLRQVLARTRVPLAGIWGEHDVTTPSGTDEVARIFADLRGDQAPLVTITDAGHWVQYEAAERFNPELLRLLSQRY